MEGKTSDEEPVRDPVLNGMEPIPIPFSSFPGELSQNESSSPPKEERVIYTHVSPIPRPDSLPSSSPPRRSPPQAGARGPSVSSQEHMELPPGFVPLSPVPPPPIMFPVGSPPPTSAIFAPSSPPRVIAPPPPAPVAVPSLPREFELTSTIIAKAQKHCRFAISSLDYEDAEQARKELRAALALLGG